MGERIGGNRGRRQRLLLGKRGEKGDIPEEKIWGGASFSPVGNLLPEKGKIFKKKDSE